MEPVIEQIDGKRYEQIMKALAERGDSVAMQAIGMCLGKISKEYDIPVTLLMAYCASAMWHAHSHAYADANAGAQKMMDGINKLAVTITEEQLRLASEYVANRMTPEEREELKRKIEGD